MTGLYFMLGCALAANTALMMGYWIKNRDPVHTFIGAMGYVAIGVAGFAALRFPA